MALSKEQFEWLQTAIATWREVQATLKEMQRPSRQVLFETVPATTQAAGQDYVGPKLSVILN